MRREKSGPRLRPAHVKLIMEDCWGWSIDHELVSEAFPTIDSLSLRLPDSPDRLIPPRWRSHRTTPETREPAMSISRRFVRLRVPSFRVLSTEARGKSALVPRIESESRPMRRNRRNAAYLPLALVAALSSCATSGFAAEPARPLSFVNDVMPDLDQGLVQFGRLPREGGERAERLSTVAARLRTPGGLRAHREGGARPAGVPGGAGAEPAAPEGRERRPARRR